MDKSFYQSVKSQEFFQLVEKKQKRSQRIYQKKQKKNKQLQVEE